MAHARSKVTAQSIDRSPKRTQVRGLAPAGTGEGPTYSSNTRQRIRLAVYLDNFDGGGVQKSTLTLAGALADRGYAVDLFVCRPGGVLADQIPQGTEVIELGKPSAKMARALALKSNRQRWGSILGGITLNPKPSPTLGYLGPLATALERRRPHTLFAATTYMNVEALLARRLAGVAARVIVTERNALRDNKLAHGWNGIFLPSLVQRTYVEADAVVAVSEGVADDLVKWAGLLRSMITTIYNPVVTREVTRGQVSQVDDPWFQESAPPVIMSAGRLGRAKDYPTLIRAFARLRRERPLHLVIFGKGKKEREIDKRYIELKRLATELGVADDVALPGFVLNPFAYMARAAVFVLSSINEGLPAVLIQAMACGCPVVSTNCPSGPSEILANGRYGRLVPPRDDAALAAAIKSTLDAPLNADFLRERADFFSVERAVRQYEQLILGDERL